MRLQLTLEKAPFSTFTRNESGKDFFNSPWFFFASSRSVDQPTIYLNNLPAW